MADTEAEQTTKQLTQSLFSAAAIDAHCLVAAAVAAVLTYAHSIRSCLLTCLFKFASFTRCSSTKLLCRLQQSSFPVSVGLQCYAPLESSDQHVPSISHCAA